MITKRTLQFTVILILAVACSSPKKAGERWSEEKANQWYSQTGWLIGCNYTPAYAVNPIEIWQAGTFDTSRISVELKWAADLGFNTVRVFLHNLVWEQDGEAYLKRIDDFLKVADRHGISTMPVLFDAVWNPVGTTGIQPEPVPHKHNSGWVQCPVAGQLKDTSDYSNLEKYTKAVISRFATDKRVVIWDLYNEPDNDNFGKFPKTELKNKRDYTYFLLTCVFAWARSVNPGQPLTAGVWWGDWSEEKLASNRFNVFQLENSDVISFHNYGNITEFNKLISLLKRFNRPLVWTEYIARPNGSNFFDMLPVMKEGKISGYNWGFVKGRSNTIYPWNSWDSVYTAEPEIWFHDILRENGEPWSPSEAEFIRKTTGHRTD